MTVTDPLSPRLTRVLGIQAPLMQSGMAGVAGPRLVAAVSNAGGLGVVAALRLAPDEVRDSIRKVRAATDQPFGVNIWLHDDVRTSPDPQSIPDDVVRSAQAVLNQFRIRLELETTLDRPPAAVDLVDTALQVMIEEKIPVFSAGLGIPEPELVERFHRVGTKVVCMVATVDDAMAAVANGVDAIAAQGGEAGGHRSYGQKHDRSAADKNPTAELVSAVVAAVGAKVPVLAAGGIVDGRGLAEMMKLGAEGALLGTRFVATQESGASDLWKTRLTTGERATTFTDGFTGQWARVLTSEFTQEWETSGAQALPGLLQAAAGQDLFSRAKKLNDDQLQPLYAGSGVDQLSDVPSAAEVVERIVIEARASLGSP
ncbi:MAG: nitronate monooxygenase [Acidimicrobiales bacterium]|nr:nitronate monooxygenase [Acidimicrobiales bacterium]MDG2219366.1 nitronate monooxygenase [Acidimicrobiales bacterium]